MWSRTRRFLSMPRRIDFRSEHQIPNSDVCQHYVYLFCIVCLSRTLMCLSLTASANRSLFARMTEMDLYMALGRKVAAARKRLGLTQAELAAQISLTRASVANIETGRQRVMLHDVFALVEALGGKSILDFVPERVPRTVVQDVGFTGDGASKEDERAMLQMIELATAAPRRRAK